MQKQWKMYLVILVTLLVVEGSYFFSLVVQKDYYVDQVTFRLNKVLKILHKYQADKFSHWQDDINDIFDSVEFYNYVNKPNSVIKGVSTKKSLEDYLLKLALIHKETKSIRFVGNDGFDKVLVKEGLISKSYINHSQETLYKEMLKTNKNLVLEKLPSNDFLIHYIKHAYIGNKKIGTLITSHSFVVVSDIFDRLTVKGLIDNVFIMDNDAQLLYSNDTDTLLTSFANVSIDMPKVLLKEGYHLYKDNIVFTKTEHLSNTKICIVTYNQTIKDYIYDMLFKNISIFISSGLLILFLFLWIVRRISAEFKRSVSKISTSENYIKAVLYMMSNLLFIVDAESMKIKQINQAVFILLGYNEKDVIDQPISSLFADDKSSKDKLENFLVNKIVSNVEVLLKSKTGTSIPVLFSSSMVEERNGCIHRKLICVAIDISKQKDVEKQLEFLAHHDALTKLSNRMDFDEILQREMARSVRAGVKFALFYLDLDGFKEVNDKFGHEVGDLLLQELAIKLKKLVRKDDVVFRVGGDEFAAIISNIHETKYISTIAKNFLESIAKTFVLQGHKIQISGSVGISVFPDDAKESNDLIRKADYAMYQAKKAGKNCYKFST